ncbi:hypothetical protein DCCM_3983 [Desulfocucumis palustris]|uniref:Uncharacterized protein n=1 Tax=Desulfocucumis palustris TaxID=1898651 RepID=A0A2L2XGM1_9FIRM|nr:hypothetical protein DCCM_3983 [Desulfocucumis palustris]
MRFRKKHKTTLSGLTAARNGRQNKTGAVTFYPSAAIMGSIA